MNKFLYILSIYRNVVDSKGWVDGSIYLFSTFVNKLVKIIYINYIKAFVPINPKLLLFQSTPDYSDNARALVEYMIDNGYGLKYDIYFSVKDIQKYNKLYSQSPITFIYTKSPYWSNSFRNLYLLFTANYILCTHGMILKKKEGRHGQHFIRLWHGCGYKDKTIYDGDGESVFDTALVPGDLFIKTKSYFWNVSPQRILAKGYPRYDWLKKGDSKAALLINQYKNISQNKVIMWMPTFRIDKQGKYNETSKITNFPLIYNCEDWMTLDNYCKTKNVVLVIKLHPFQKDYNIPFDIFSNIKKIDDDDFEKSGVTLYQFLYHTDGLISDYSSVAIDYLIVNHPIAFTLDDFDLYKNSRGFIFEDPKKYMPGHHLYTQEDLKDFISDVSCGLDSFQLARKDVMSVAIHQSECYCNEILNTIGIV